VHEQLLVVEGQPELEGHVDGKQPDRGVFQQRLGVVVGAAGARAAQSCLACLGRGARHVRGFRCGVPRGLTGCHSVACRTACILHAAAWRAPARRQTMMLARGSRPAWAPKWRAVAVCSKWQNTERERDGCILEARAVLEGEHVRDVHGRPERARERGVQPVPVPVAAAVEGQAAVHMPGLPAPHSAKGLPWACIAQAPHSGLSIAAGGRGCHGGVRRRHQVSLGWMMPKGSFLRLLELVHCRSPAAGLSDVAGAWRCGRRAAECTQRLCARVRGSAHLGRAHRGQHSEPRVRMRQVAGPAPLPPARSPLRLPRRARRRLVQQRRKLLLVARHAAQRPRRCSACLAVWSSRGPAGRLATEGPCGARARAGSGATRSKPDNRAPRSCPSAPDQR
jgi:hypothetical protein